MKELSRILDSTGSSKKGNVSKPWDRGVESQNICVFRKITKHYTVIYNCKYKNSYDENFYAPMCSLRTA